MPYFYSKRLIAFGGGGQFYRVVATNVPEHRGLAKKYAEFVTNREPPRRDMLKSRILPMILVAKKHEALLERIGAVEVPEEYIPVLAWRLKKEFWLELATNPAPGDEKKLIGEIRAKLVILLEAEAWVENPEHSDLKNLNAALENFDLGRRSDLKFSKYQSPESRKRSENFRKITFKERQRDLREFKEDLLAPSQEERKLVTTQEERVEAPVFADKPWLKSGQ